MMNNFKFYKLDTIDTVIVLNILDGEKASYELDLDNSNAAESIIVTYDYALSDDLLSSFAEDGIIITEVEPCDFEETEPTEDFTGLDENIL